MLISRPFTTFIHEMGHAIPALLFSDKEVTIFVGSYGDPKDSTVLQFGRLTTFFKYKVTQWDMGVCAHGPAKHMLGNLLIILGGPIASLLFGLIALFLIKMFVFNAAITYILAVFLVSFCWDFFVNIVPHSSPAVLHNGNMIYNDGYQLVKQWRQFKYPESYFQGVDHLNNSRFHTAAEHFEKAIKEGFQTKDIYRNLMLSYTAGHDEMKVIETFRDFKEKHKPDPEDFAVLGSAYNELGYYGAAITAYDNALYKAYQNKDFLFGRAMVFMKQKKYQDAIMDLDLVIGYAPNYTEAYAYRGLACSYMGENDEALKYMKHALNLDNNNEIANLNLGIHAVMQKDYRNAMIHLDAVEKINPQNDKLDFWRRECENM